VRADTTVISANVAYPTDVGLLAKAVGKLVRQPTTSSSVGRQDVRLLAPRTPIRGE